MREQAHVAPMPNHGPVLRGLLNGVKHTAASFAQLHGLDARELEAVIQGTTSLSKDIIQAVANHPPLNVRDLYDPKDRHLFPVQDDTTDGVVVFTAAEREETLRTFERGSQGGPKVPFYHYADTAMSRTSLFRPEWIQELHVHDGDSPELSDWAFNHGHFECQLTYYIGPVNLHWIDRQGRKHVRRMNTGDTNYGTPFVPHTFTTRVAGNGLILAVTYGGSLATEKFRSRIADMSPQEFCAEMGGQLPVLKPGLPTDELGGVMIQRYPDAERTESDAYTVRTLLSGIPFQPWTRAMEYVARSSAEELDLEADADRWGYHVGLDPVVLRWGNHTQVLHPGDSFFIQPKVRHAFRRIGLDSRVVVIEIKPEAGDPLAELALIAKYAGDGGLARVHSETQQWF